MWCVCVCACVWLSFWPHMFSQSFFFPILDGLASFCVCVHARVRLSFWPHMFSQSFFSQFSMVSRLSPSPPPNSLSKVFPPICFYLSLTSPNSHCHSPSLFPNHLYSKGRTLVVTFTGELVSYFTHSHLCS